MGTAVLLAAVPGGFGLLSLRDLLAVLGAVLARDLLTVLGAVLAWRWGSREMEAKLWLIGLNGCWKRSGRTLRLVYRPVGRRSEKHQGSDESGQSGSSNPAE
jgi:hypothetical protein